MRLAKLANDLSSLLQRELVAQRRLEEMLEAQVAAALVGDTAAIEATTADLDAAFSEESARERARRAIVADFGRELGVPAQLMTVGSLLARLAEQGVDTEKLAHARAELKDAVLRVRKLARKLSTVARGHGEVLGDVLRLIAGTGERAPEAGCLVDAEG